MSAVRYSNVVADLFRVLPEIRMLYEKRSPEIYAEGNPHIVYGSIFVEFVEALVKDIGGPNHDCADQQIKRAFGLIEELSASSDSEARCLAETSVLEGLLGEKGGLKRFAPYMQAETRTLAREIANRWGLNTDVLS